jgi:hypothetical protein
MGTIYYFTEAGRAGGTWYGAQYPLGATRYYRTEATRDAAVKGYIAAIEATSGYCWISSPTT